MKIARKRPGEPWELADVENTLEAMQAEVGGYIEAVPFTADACIVVNEEGLILGLPYNVNFAGLRLYGTVLLVGVAGDEFCDVPLTERGLRVLPK